MWPSTREVLAGGNVELSIVRVGSLKGGGPGEAEEGELGLHKSYYDSIVDLSIYMATSAYDKFTLGASVSAGDPFDMPNPLLRAAKQGSFEASDAETSRTVAASV